MAADEALEQRVWAALEQVNDPELPNLSVIDLGMVASVQCHAGRATVRMMPTFLGCPALPIISANVCRQLRTLAGVESADVQFVHDEPWTTDRITAAGKRKLGEFGIAPPACSLWQQPGLAAACPYCGSAHTRLDNLFGPTACRSVFYCEDCRQPFEAMKPV